MSDIFKTHNEHEAMYSCDQVRIAENIARKNLMLIVQDQRIKELEAMIEWMIRHRVECEGWDEERSEYVLAWDDEPLTLPKKPETPFVDAVREIMADSEDKSDE